MLSQFLQKKAHTLHSAGTVPWAVSSRNSSGPAKKKNRISRKIQKLHPKTSFSGTLPSISRTESLQTSTNYSYVLVAGVSWSRRPSWACHTYISIYAVIKYVFKTALLWSCREPNLYCIHQKYPVSPLLGPHLTNKSNVPFESLRLSKPHPPI